LKKRSKKLLSVDSADARRARQTRKVFLLLFLQKKKNP